MAALLSQVSWVQDDSPKTEKEALADSLTTLGGSFRDNSSDISVPLETENPYQRWHIL